MKRGGAAVLLLAALLLAGCRDQKIIERLGFIRCIAYDLAGGNADEANKSAGSEDGGNKSGGSGSGQGRLNVSISIPKAEPLNSRILLSTEAESSKTARLAFKRMNNRQLVNGQLQTVLFGDALARRGLGRHLDTLVRDPSIGSRVRIVVVRGSANKLLAQNFREYPETGQYIHDLLNTEERTGSLPITNVYSFARDYYDDGIDPVAPVMKTAGGKLAFDGVALFRQDRLVKIVSYDESSAFSVLLGSFGTGDMAFTLSPQGGAGETEVAMLNFVSNKRSMKVKTRSPLRGGEDIELLVRMKIRGELLEYTGGLNLQRFRDQKLLESQLAAKLTGQLKQLIRDIQQSGSDAIGAGQVVRNHLSYAEWKALNWDRLYPTIRIRVKVDIKIKDFGKMQ